MNYSKPRFPRLGHRSGVHMRPSESSRIPAIITGHLALPGRTNVWEYTWVEAVWSPGNKAWIEKPTNPRSGVAFNTMETANEGIGVESGGVNIDGTDFPATMAIVPIRGDATTNVWPAGLGPVVILDTILDDVGGIAYHFTVMNAVDGTCT